MKRINENYIGDGIIKFECVDDMMEFFKLYCPDLPKFDTFNDAYEYMGGQIQSWFGDYYLIEHPLDEAIKMGIVELEENELIYNNKVYTLMSATKDDITFVMENLPISWEYFPSPYKFIQWFYSGDEKEIKKIAIDYIKDQEE